MNSWVAQGHGAVSLLEVRQLLRDPEVSPYSFDFSEFMIHTDRIRDFVMQSLGKGANLPVEHLGLLASQISIELFQRNL